VHLVGFIVGLYHHAHFIVGLYHHAQSPERQNKSFRFPPLHWSMYIYKRYIYKFCSHTQGTYPLTDRWDAKNVPFTSTIYYTSYTKILSSCFSWPAAIYEF